MVQKAKFVQENKFVAVIAPGVYSTDQLSSAIDLQGADEVTLLAVVGTAGITLDASNFISLELQDSADGITYAPVVDANTFGAVTPGTGAAATGSFGQLNDMNDDVKVFASAYKGNKRYLKVNVNFVGTHGTGTPLCVLAVKGGGGVPISY